MRHTTATADEPRSRVRLTDEGQYWLVAAFLLGAVGWWKSISLVMLLAYLMLALVLINWVLARVQVRRVAVTREPTPPAFAGEITTLLVTVANTGTRPATVMVENEVAEAATDWLVLQLPPGGRSLCTSRRVFPTRGVFPAPAVRVRSGYPFGLFADRRGGGAGQDVVVLPAVGAVDPAGLRRWVLMQVGGDGRMRKVLRRVTTDQADVRGVRPYRSGDPIRAIHWRSSARRGELMVREYDAAPAPDLVVVVEPWLPAPPASFHRDRLEAALSLTATIVLTWVRVYGTRVTVAVAGDGDSVRSTTSSDAGVRAALAPLAAVAGADRFDVPPPRAFGRWLGRATRLVVSSRTGSPYAAALSRATGRTFVPLSPVDCPRWYLPPGTETDLTELVVG